MTRTEEPTAAMSQEERKKLREAAEKVIDAQTVLDMTPRFSSTNNARSALIDAFSAFSDFAKPHVILALLAALDAAEARVAGAVAAERERCARIAERGEYTITIRGIGTKSNAELAAFEEGSNAADRGIATAIRSAP